VWLSLLNIEILNSFVIAGIIEICLLELQPSFIAFPPPAPLKLASLCYNLLCSFHKSTISICLRIVPPKTLEWEQSPRHRFAICFSQPLVRRQGGESSGEQKSEQKKTTVRFSDQRFVCHVITKRNFGRRERFVVSSTRLDQHNEKTTFFSYFFSSTCG
jgi:hypothetical protein